jgi:hypothetical protein
LVGFLFLCGLFGNIATVHHVPTATEFALLFSALRYAVTLAGLGWVLYMAFEPQLRRRDPESLISWNRLLAGRARDPVVGGHLLAGVTLGVLTFCVVNAFVPLRFVPSFAPKLANSTANWFSFYCGELITGVLVGLFVALGLNVVSIVVRRRWLCVPIFVLATTLVLAPGYGALSFASVARPCIVTLIAAIALIRFGVLAAVALGYTSFTIQDFPLTTNWSAWYAQATILVLATLLALALYGFVTTLRGRPLSQIRPRALSATAT